MINHPPSQDQPPAERPKAEEPPVEEPAAPEPVEQPAPAPATDQYGLRRLRISHRAYLEKALPYLVEKNLGSSPQVRLFALVCLTRAARSGTGNLVGDDLRRLRLTDGVAALRELSAPGWLTCDTDVMTATPEHPAGYVLPEFTENPWQMGKVSAKRISGWVSDVVSHRRLRKVNHQARLAAVHLTAHSDVAGSSTVSAADMAKFCLAKGPGDVVDLVKVLLQAGWLTGVAPAGAGSLTVTLSTDAQKYVAAPEQAPTEPPVPGSRRQVAKEAVHWSMDRRISEGRKLTEGREQEIADWIQKFRDVHNHGPSWGAVAAHLGWPRRHGPERQAANGAIELLLKEDWLAGQGVPYGLRPGSRYEA
ncbi:hypothetical protein D5S17_06425 [Pseudonocardiaceae bacterium YIM PH 21723]|nr:hypothetical protein D5S17_06425 [Pseudonocardiaceae bacterium YIM PH 21723]